MASALDKNVEDVTAIILDGPRHERIIAEIRRAGARVKLISDGDVSAAIATAIEGSGLIFFWYWRGSGGCYCRRCP